MLNLFFKKFKLSYGGNMHKKQKDNREKQDAQSFHNERQLIS